MRFGVVRQRVEFSKISSVEPSHSPLSAPALSMDRLRITTGTGLTGSVVISPADREGFLQLLAERSGLVRKGDKLIRR